jgi:ribonucleoside-diphosphate reductase beta chain
MNKKAQYNMTTAINYSGQKYPTLMSDNALFNPNGNDTVENRSIWFGETTNLMQLNDVRYSWAVGLYKQMRENFWVN